MASAIVMGLLVILALPGAEGAQAPATIDLLPAEEAVAGWETSTRRTCSTAKALFDYMNGGAEIYLDYGFQDLAVGEWTSPDGYLLKVEVYGMKAPHGAYGMFTQDTWGEAVEIGQGGRIQGGSLRFWKGPYLVRVFMWRGYEDHLDVILEMGKKVSGRIQVTGEIPEVVSLLPAGGRVEGGLHFFHTSLTLGGFYYLSEGNPLGLSKETDGAIGEYRLDDGTTVFLILVSYRDSEVARAALESFVRGESSQATIEGEDGPRAFLAYEDGLWRAIHHEGSFVGLALDCPAKELCGRMLEKMMANLAAASREEAKTGKDSTSDWSE